MSDLVEFLRARLDEDELAAAYGPSGRTAPADLEWTYLPGPDDELPGGDVIARGHRIVVDSPEVIASHIARHDPKRVLADVAAKRRIVADYEASVRSVGDGLSGSLRRVVQLLALPYADHDDYRPDWRPT